VATGCFLLGAAASGLWFRSANAKHPASSEPQGETGTPAQQILSAGTKRILGQLPSPVEIHFYSVLDQGAANDSLRLFAGRVDQLLQAYQAAAGGKLKVKRFDSQGYSSADGAVADGIKPFNNEKENPSFLGIAVIHGAQKQTLPQLSPEWEFALEADLSRAIAHVSEESAGRTPSPEPQVVAAAAEEVKRVLPNFNSISLEEGTRILREAALKQFKEAVTESQNQLQQAGQALNQAQASGSVAEQQTAIKHLQQLQGEQTERLKQIAADSQAQIEALRRLKAATP
jgi:hypothetical protein